MSATSPVLRAGPCRREPLNDGATASRPRDVPATAGALLLAAACLALMPCLAQAQSGSALYPVGDPGARKSTRPANAPPPAAAAPSPAVVKKKPVAKRASRARKAADGAAGPLVLNGRWEDSHCIPLAGAVHHPPFYVKRHYEFEDKRKTWHLSAAVYASADCAGMTRLLTYQGAGTYAVTGKSAVVRDAYDASFKVVRWSAIPDSREGVLTLLNARCGSGDFEKGRPLDLSSTGCAVLGIRSIEQAPREVELVRAAEGKVFMGSHAFVPAVTDARQAQANGYRLRATP